MSGTIKKGSVTYTSPVSRRVFLRGAGGAALSLPLFNDLVSREARAQSTTAAFPKRLLIVFTPNGSVASNYFGAGNTDSLALGSIMDPLAPHKNDLLVLDNLDMQAASASTGDAHGVGMGCMLTGKKLQSGELFGAGMGGAGSGWADNISIDQLIAATVGTKTPLGSLELAGKRFAGNVWSRISYKGAANPVAPEEDPQRAFDRVFANTGSGANSAAIMRLAARRKSVLDNSIAELTSLSPKLSAADRLKLDQHTSTLRDLELRIANMAMTGTMASQCKPPTRPTVMASPEVIANSTGMEKIVASNDKTFPDIIKAQMDTMVGAFACDITRVGSIIMAPSRSDVVLSWLKFNGAAMTESHHEISHYQDTEKDAPAKLTLINQWYAQQIADMVAKMKAIPEGSGTMFDSTLIAWVNELGIGISHSHTRIPLAFIGSCQGYFKTGRYMKLAKGTSMNSYLVSMANAMGVTPAVNGMNNIFGDPNFCKGPLTGLTA